MLVVASETHRGHHPRRPLLDGAQLIEHPEVPDRVDRILAALDDARIGPPETPHPFPRAAMGRVHTPDYLEFLEHAHARWRDATGLDELSEATPSARMIRGQPYPGDDPLHVFGELGLYSHDNDPVLGGTWTAAVGAVDVALTACEALAIGRAPAAYACTRPPGHHAATDSFAGYCYLNNAALAAQAWVERGGRVAILDIDYHHGNGTQQIFYDRDDVLFVSLHADPAFEYPFLLGFATERGWGAGEDCTRNFPLPEGTDWETYRPALEQACEVVQQYAPDALVVSLGVDTALEEPDTFRLVADDYLRLGETIARLDRPTLLVQEGGYCLDVIGRNVVNLLLPFT